LEEVLLGKLEVMGQIPPHAWFWILTFCLQQDVWLVGRRLRKKTCDTSESSTWAGLCKLNYFLEEVQIKLNLKTKRIIIVVCFTVRALSGPTDKISM
jgi:hypothetical protein